jgi:hypothetical protein
MRYRICAPEKDYTGKIGTVGFVDGVAYADADEDAPALRYFRSQGYTVEEYEGDPAHSGELAAEAEKLRAHNEALLAFARPAKSASAEQWRAYAVLAGMPEDEAAALSRDDLAARYTKEEA